MRSLLRYALLTLVLLLVAAVSALTAMRFAIHGREARVPKLVGLTSGEARTATAGNGLLLTVENRFYSADVPAGHIVSQDPAPGERVRRGWEVRVAESLGPQRHIIPSVVGQSQRAAEINLRRRGLDVGTVSTVAMPDFPPDQVVAQSPPPNAGAASPRVDLLVVAPLEDQQQEYVMPELVGRHLPDAVKTLEASGLHIGKVADAIGAASPAGTITRQSPAAGQKIVTGTAVNLEVVR